MALAAPRVCFKEKSLGTPDLDHSHTTDVNNNNSDSQWAKSVEEDVLTTQSTSPALDAPHQSPIGRVVLLLQGEVFSQDPYFLGVRERSADDAAKYMETGGVLYWIQFCRVHHLGTL